MAAPAQHQGPAPGLPTPPAAPRAPHRRVNVPAPPSPGHAGNNNNGQQPGRPPGGPRPHQPQGNQPIPHPAVARLRLRRRRRIDWLRCGGHGRAGAFWAFVSVLSGTVFFLASWLKPQDDTYAKATYELQLFQSDVEAKRLCVLSNAQKLTIPGLDCDVILSTPVPTRHSILESTVGLLLGPPSRVLSSMLAGLLLVWDFLFNNPQVAALTTCVLAVVIALAMSPERPARPAAEELVRALVGERASSDSDSDDRSEGLVQRMWLCCYCGMGPYPIKMTPQCLCSHHRCSGCRIERAAPSGPSLWWLGRGYDDAGHPPPFVYFIHPRH